MKYFIIVGIFFAMNLSCSPGCMDNSWHLTRPFDTKTYHPVTQSIGRSETYCPCDCTVRNGICIKCGHRNDSIPRDFIIIRYSSKRSCS